MTALFVVINNARDEPCSYSTLLALYRTVNSSAKVGIVSSLVVYCTKSDYWGPFANYIADYLS